jgi:haloacetate dehalogenase
MGRKRITPHPDSVLQPSEIHSGGKLRKFCLFKREPVAQAALAWQLMTTGNTSMDGPGYSWSGGSPAQIARFACREVAINVRIEGVGPPVILLHGYPQNHWMWRRCLPFLTGDHTVIMPDLRGYGASDKPPGDPAHSNYSKRAMAGDIVQLLDRLEIDACPVIGHDRGARVVHRLARDHPGRVSRAGVVDILPTAWHFAHYDAAFAQTYWHWAFLAAPDGEPEKVLAADPGGFLERRLRAWSRTPDCFDPGDLAEYQRCFCEPACIHATCEDYRAASSIDLEHDTAEEFRQIEMPMLLVWGAQGFIGSRYDPPAVWADYASDITARPINCGHFPAEERPQETAAAISDFLRGHISG